MCPENLGRKSMFQPTVSHYLAMQCEKGQALLLTAKRAGMQRSLYRLRRRIQLQLIDPLLAQYLYPLPQTDCLDSRQLSPTQYDWCTRILSLHAPISETPAWNDSAQTVTLLNQAPFSLQLPVCWHDLSDADQPVDPLWVFQLHSWDWAWSGIHSSLDSDAGRGTFVLLVQDWLANVPIGRGLAWEPYPTARRLLVWSVAYHAICARQQLAPGFSTGFSTEFAAAIAQHAAYLADHFERDLDNNHLIVNAKALVWVGLLLPHLPRAPKWLALGQRTFWQAFADQVRKDGGHVENSTSYHLSALLDGLETVSLCQACGEVVSADHLHLLTKMRRLARSLLRPDGQLPLLNDSVALDKTATSAIFSLADEVLGVEAGKEATKEAKGSIEAFFESGIVCLRAGHGSDETYLLFDAGDLGPEHCPGHGHADTLSFELWHGAQPLVIDPGTFQYAAGEWRDYFRSTAAHSTATVDAQNQSTFVGPFRLGHLAHGQLLTATEKDGTLEAVGEHDGYLRLPDPVLHKRRICLEGAHQITIEDSFSGNKLHEIVLRLHLAPCAVELIDQTTASAIYPNGLRMFVYMDNAVGRWTKEDGWHSQAWYQKEPSPVLAFTMNVQLPSTCKMNLVLRN